MAKEKPPQVSSEQRQLVDGLAALREAFLAKAADMMKTASPSEGRDLVLTYLDLQTATHDALTFDIQLAKEASESIYDEPQP